MRRVVFHSDRVLEDVDEGNALRWRKEGSGGDDDDDDDDASDDEVYAAEAVAGAAGGVTTMVDVLEAQDKIDKEQGDGDTLEQASNRAFGTLPMDQQQHLAHAFSGFKDKFIAGLRGLVESNGEGYAVSKDDIENIMGGIRDAK